MTAEQSRVFVQTVGPDEKLELYRIQNGGQVLSSRVIKDADDAGGITREDVFSEAEQLRIIDIFLGLNISTAVVLGLAALRYRSRGLAVASAVNLGEAGYLVKKRLEHAREHQWRKREAAAVENYGDNVIEFPRES